MVRTTARVQVWSRKQMEQLLAKREAGQGALEYIGMVAVAALVVITILGFAQSWDFTDILTQAVTKIKEAAGW